LWKSNSWDSSSSLSQLDHGFDHCLHANAPGMEIEDGAAQETSIDGHVRPWDNVRLGNRLQYFADQDRICVITIFRIVFIFSLINDPHDSTYWIAVNAIFLTLEPNLGIVNACLLLLKPILQRMRPKLGWTTQNPGSQDYPLKTRSRDRPSTLLPTKYGLKNTDGIGNFTRLGDNDERLDVAQSFAVDGNSNSSLFPKQGADGLVFGNQTKEVTVGDRDQRTFQQRVSRLLKP